MARQNVSHPFEPVWDENSRILILGSFPSVRSREIGFYYAHPQNRFWPLMELLFQEPVGSSAEERRVFALRHGVALWDSIESCLITGSSDASIRDAKPNDIAGLIRKTRIQRVYCNGQQSYRLYQKYCAEACGMPAIPLPSTSAANAAWTIEKLAQAWKVILG